MSKPDKIFKAFDYTVADMVAAHLMNEVGITNLDELRAYLAKNNVSVMSSEGCGIFNCIDDILKGRKKLKDIPKIIIPS